MKEHFLLHHTLQTKSGILQVATVQLFGAATARHVQVPTQSRLQMTIAGDGD
jgi:hypothetical protein